MAPKKASKISDTPEFTHWLLKAEPETRIEKGVDVKFSIDDFEAAGETAWEGVRNHQAKNYLKSSMKLGQRCLFYASNCKVPGVTGLAKVKREGYPDHNAWDPKHPYYDPKSNSENPTWYMVDLEFVSRLPHLVPLALLQHLGTLDTVPECTPYLTEAHLKAIAGSALISRGRLSVQGATEEFYEAVELLGTKGGFEELVVKKSKAKPKKEVKDEDVKSEGEENSKPKSKGKAKAAPKGKKRASKVKTEESDDEGGSEEEVMPAGSSSRPSKRVKKE